MAGLNERDELNEPLGLAAPRIAAADSLSAQLALDRLRPRSSSALGVFLVETGRSSRRRALCGRLAGQPSSRSASAAAAASADAAAATPAAPPAASSASQVEMSSGVKVVRAGGAAAPGSLIIAGARGDRAASDAGAGQAAGREIADTACCRASAPTARGPPKSMRGRSMVSAQAEGRRAARRDHGRRPRPRTRPARSPRSPSLPGAVSLGFAPYGDDLERDAAQAREAGHEMLLQAPMEPFDYPANNPGPHTLLDRGLARPKISTICIG